jgi:hypothetical protein
MQLLSVTRELLRLGLLNLTLLWWLLPILNHLTFYQILSISEKRVRSRRAILRKENIMFHQVTDRVGTAIHQVIGPKIVLILRRI